MDEEKELEGISHFSEFQKRLLLHNEKIHEIAKLLQELDF